MQIQRIALLDAAKAFSGKFRRFRILQNPKGLSASGWNLGIASAEGEIISILSGHVILAKNYLSRLIRHLTPDVAGAGGRALPCGFNKRSEQISRAFRTRLGSGGATHIRGSTNRYAETISLPDVTGKRTLKRSEVSMKGSSGARTGI
ncbi:MAG: hypothetical protein U5N26_11880 [Candidatus Marinimicrobia bacterium]|nr:hypothetical protein [Candidatus Neomarinimicrobiota bacterium]